MNAELKVLRYNIGIFAAERGAESAEITPTSSKKQCISSENRIRLEIKESTEVCLCESLQGAIYLRGREKILGELIQYPSFQ
jgi:hypothetical protein